MKEFFAAITIWNLFEICAVATGMIYVFLQVKKTRKMWRWMIISSIFNGIVYFHKGYNAMTLMQFYYIGMAIYGIATWSKVVEQAIEQHGPDDRKKRTKIAIVPASAKKIIISGAVALAAFAGLYLFNSSVYEYIEGDVPYKPIWDSAVAVLSMLATYYLSQSFIQNWYIWLVVNVSGIFMFLYPVFVGHAERALPLFGMLYIYYLVTATVGLINWKKKGVIVKQQQTI